MMEDSLLISIFKNSRILSTFVMSLQINLSSVKRQLLEHDLGEDDVTAKMWE